MTDGTCVVALHFTDRHGVPEYEGFVLVRALAAGCGQAGRWHRAQVDAEADALRMDGHRCPERASDEMARVIPRDRARTPGVALLSPDTALRYVPWQQ